MVSKSADTHCTHPAVAICPGLVLFPTTSKGLSIFVFPSVSLHNFLQMTPLREKTEAQLLKHEWVERTYGCPDSKQLLKAYVFKPIYSKYLISHLLQWGGSTGEDKGASAGEPSEWQIKHQHLQKQHSARLSETSRSYHTIFLCSNIHKNIVPVPKYTLEVLVLSWICPFNATLYLYSPTIQKNPFYSSIFIW